MPIHNNNDSLSILPLKASILLFMNNLPNHPFSEQLRLESIHLKGNRHNHFQIIHISVVSILQFDMAICLKVLQRPLFPNALDYNLDCHARNVK